MVHAINTRLPVLRGRGHVVLPTGRVTVLERRDEVHELRMEVAKLQDTLQALVLTRSQLPVVASVQPKPQAIQVWKPVRPARPSKQRGRKLRAVRSVMRYLAD